MRRCEEAPSGAQAEEALEELDEGTRSQEATKVEEILRLEREIQALQRQKEQQELTLTQASLHRLQLLRDQELRRLEDEACRAAQHFLDSLNFDEIDECVRNIESSLGGGEGETERELGRRRGSNEEEVDEGFGADDEAFKDSPNPSEHGHSDGQRTSGIRTSDDSSEEDPYANDGVAPPTLLHQPLPPVPAADSAYCRPQPPAEAQVELIPPDEDSDYDQDDYDEGAIVSGGSVAFPGAGAHHWSPEHRGSVGTCSSSGAYRFSSEGAQSSVSPCCSRRNHVTRAPLLNASLLPSFSSRTARTTWTGWTPTTSSRTGGTPSTAASRCPTSTASSTSKVPPALLRLPELAHAAAADGCVLSSPGGLMNMWKRRWCVLKDETFLWFRAKQEALKQGWLHKKGGGSSTLSRRNWKRRWFVLRQSRLMYFENDSEEKMKGVLDVHAAR